MSAAASLTFQWPHGSSRTKLHDHPSLFDSVPTIARVPAIE